MSADTSFAKRVADKKKVWDFLKDDDNVIGVGIGADDIRVYLEYSDGSGLQTFTEIKGVPVTFVVTGAIKTLDENDER